MSKVSRSVYQKVCEENKKLMKDIRILTQKGLRSSEYILCVAKWREHFEEERQFNEAMRIACKTYIENHKDEKYK